MRLNIFNLLLSTHYHGVTLISFGVTFGKQWGAEFWFGFFSIRIRKYDPMIHGDKK